MIVKRHLNRIELHSDQIWFQVHVGPMRPTSRGYLKLQSSDPTQHPIIQPNYLSTEIDRWEMRESIKLSREIFSQKAFDEYCERETEPGVITNYWLKSEIQ